MTAAEPDTHGSAPASPSQRRFPFIPNIFYGWWILAAGTATMAIVGATSNYGLALLFVPLTTEFGWSRTAAAGALSLGRLEGGLLGPLEGMLVDKLGPRRMMFIGLPLIATGMFALTHISDIAAFTGWDTLILFYCIWVFLIAMGNSIGIFSSVSAAVANWFVRRRGLALGIQASGLGFGAGIWTPVMGQVIENQGWRMATLVACFMVLIIGIPSALLMRHRPEQYGLLPDGDTVPQARTSEATSHGRSAPRSGVADEENFTLRQALKTRAFWVIACSASFRVLITAAVILHLAPLLRDMGWSTGEAAWAVSALAILGNVGRIGLGIMSDRFEKRKVYACALVTLGLGVSTLAFATETWHIVLFLLLYAPSYGGSATVVSAMRADYFGRRAYATIQGAMGPITTAGTITGPLFAAYMFDTTGTYRGAMLVFAACIALNLVLLQFLRQPHLDASNAPSALGVAS